MLLAINVYVWCYEKSDVCLLRRNVCLLRIVEVFVCRHFQHFVEVFGGFPACFGKVHQQIVAAVFGGLTWNFAIVGGDEGECLSHEW